LLLSATWQSDWHAYLAGVNPDLYRPIGLIKILGSGVPGPTFLFCCQWIAYVSTWMVIVGLLTRLSFVVSTVSMWMLLSLPWCFMGGQWCHGHNVILLAAIAMMFGPSSPLSVDAWINRWRSRGQPAGMPMDEKWHRWPVLLAQFAVAMMFTNAAFWKLFQPFKPLGVWALSDSLRNHLILQYWVLREPMPGWLDWVLHRPWAYQLMGLGNLLTQATPVLACLLVRRPRWRAVAGLALVLETFMIGQVMHLDNPLWFLLYAFFVDWDRLFAWVKNKLMTSKTKNEEAAAVLSRGGWAFRLACLWILAFAGFYLVVAFAGKAQRRFTYPFTSWPLYCGVMADRPYGEHKPWTILGSTWTVAAEPPVPQAALDDVWRGHWTSGLRPWAETSGFLTQIKNNLERRYKTRISRMALEKTSYQIQPHPDFAVRPCQTAIACLWQREGGFKGLETKRGYDPLRGKHFIEIVSHGLTSPTYRIGYHLRHTGPWQPLEVEQEGNRFFYEENEPGAFLAVRVHDAAAEDEELVFAVN
jgi:hypothetical protein